LTFDVFLLYHKENGFETGKLLIDYGMNVASLIFSYQHLGWGQWVT